MRMMKTIVYAAALSALPFSNAWAADGGWHSTRAWNVTFGAEEAPAAPALTLPTTFNFSDPADKDTDQQRTTAVTYSDAYAVRAKIHRWASYATLPLFGAQYILGTKLDNGTGGEPVRATHAAIATSMVGLFGVNSVTGLWNLWESRNDPTKRGRRLLHGLLMLGADGGFMATGMLAPTNDGGGNRDLHKQVAITSMVVATTGYLIMLFGN